jgi:mono/diheme cytochrome c family protein
MVSKKLAINMLFMTLLMASGCKATPPGKAETSAITWIKHRITVGDKHSANPFPSTAENIKDGQQAFASYCSVCHGLDGQNTGVPFAQLLSPPVPSLASSTVQSYTDGQLKWIIENGVSPSGMPPSKGVFNDDDIWRMVLFIRHLPAAGSLGEPPAYNPATQAKD